MTAATAALLCQHLRPRRQQQSVNVNGDNDDDDSGDANIYGDGNGANEGGDGGLLFPNCHDFKFN